MTSGLASTLTEAQFQSKVIALAEVRGWLVAHFTSAQARSGRWVTPMLGDSGFPDLVLARDGEIVIAELKREVGYVTAGQARWLEGLTGAEGWRGKGARTAWVSPTQPAFAVFVWRPSDWRTIEDVLE